MSIEGCCGRVPDDVHVTSCLVFPSPRFMSSLIVAGSTGAIGREVVKEAVRDQRITRVVALSRRDIPEERWTEVFGGELDVASARTKLKVVPVDWEQLWDVNRSASYLEGTSTLAAAFADHNFAAMCMGTTRKDAGSAAAFEHCDFDFVSAFANVVRTRSPSLTCYSQISSQGADATSWFLYMKTKGRADAMAASVGFPRVSIFRPGLLGRGDRARFVESLLGLCITPLSVNLVAVALVRDLFSEHTASGAVYFSNTDIKRLAQ